MLRETPHVAVSSRHRSARAAGRAERLRTLWLHRRLVAASAALALLGFVLATYRISFPATFEPRRYEVGTANTTVLLDTPRSRAVDLRKSMSMEILSYRAKLLAELLLDPVLTDAIAQRLGVPPGHVVAAPLLPAATVSGAQLDVTDRRAYVLRAEVPWLDGGANPIMTFKTTAPSPEAAAQLADAMVQTLRAYVAAIQEAQATPPARRLVLAQLSAPVAEPLRRGPQPLLNAVAALGMVAVSCALILVIVALRPDRWRRAPTFAHG